MLYSSECETKCLRLNLEHKTEDLIEKLEAGLEKAREDVMKHQTKEGLALCFAIPTMHKPKVYTADAKFCALLKSVEKSVKSYSLCDAAIWIGFKKGESKGNDYRFLAGLPLFEP